MAMESIKVATANKVKTDLKELLATRYSTKQRSSSSIRPSIYKVPDYISGVNLKAYEPQVVSFGPYHHGEPHLLPMEEHKQTAFLYFQSICDCDSPIETIVERVANVLECLQGCYHNLEAKWRDEPARFLQLMILDGCFLLEVLNFTAFEGPPHPVFSSHGQLHMFPYIERDMLLLQNQLPLVLLDELCFIRPQSQDARSLVSQYFFRQLHKDLIGDFVHVLDIYRANLLVPRKHYNEDQTDKASNDEENPITRSATEVREAGITFKQSKTKSLMDISFKAGVLRLPHFVVDDQTESTFLNLMAFEKLHAGAGTQVTDYIYFMDNLIEVDEDVGVLTSKKIMVNGLGNKKDAAELLNLLAKGANMDPNSHLNAVQRKVNEHCGRPCNEWCANLKHTYFQNPWAIVSLFAAVLGFALVILQTGYDIYGYHHPRP